MTVPSPYYEQCGLRLRSSMPLPLREVSASDAVDVALDWGEPIDSTAVPAGEVLACMDTDEGRWYTAVDDGEHLRFRFHECGDFVISRDLTRVRCHPDPHGRHELLPVLMAGTVSAFILLMRGRTVLHASAVAWDDAALAFIGQSGRGKTTMAALLCADGASLVADDLLVVEPGPPVVCQGGSVELRLRDGARPLAETFAAHAGTRETEDARLGLRAAAVETGSLRLGAIVIPAPSRTATTMSVTRVDAANAVFCMLAFPRVTGVTRPDLLRAQFEVLSDVAASVPIYTAEIPWGPPFAAEIPARLRGLLESKLGQLTRR